MTQPSPNLISVLCNSHDCVGFLRSAGARGFQAYDAARHLLGLFQDKQTAIEAIMEPKFDRRLICQNPKLSAQVSYTAPKQNH